MTAPEKSARFPVWLGPAVLGAVLAAGGLFALRGADLPLPAAEHAQDAGPASPRGVASPGPDLSSDRPLAPPGPPQPDSRPSPAPTPSPPAHADGGETPPQGEIRLPQSPAPDVEVHEEAKKSPDHGDGPVPPQPTPSPQHQLEAEQPPFKGDGVPLRGDPVGDVPNGPAAPVAGASHGPARIDLARRELRQCPAVQQGPAIAWPRASWLRFRNGRLRVR